MSQPRDTAAVETHFTEALPFLERGVKKARADMFFYAAAAVLCIVALSFTADLEMPFGLNFVVVVIRVLLVLGLGYNGWMGVIMTNKEINCLTAAKKDINNLIKSNPT